MNIYLVRHGETDWNKEGRLQGRMDIDMNENGLEQVQKIAAKFQTLNEDIDLIVSSPLKRAKISADLIADAIGYEKNNILEEPLFIERSFGSSEGLVYDPFSLNLEKELGWEPLETLIERAKTGMEKYMSRASGQDLNQNVVIAAHGAILKAVMIALTNGKISYEDKSFEIKQGVIVKLLCEENKLVRFEEIVC